MLNTLTKVEECVPNLARNKPPGSVFETADLDLATYLYARAYPLLGVDLTDGMVVVRFPSQAELSAEAFYSGATVTAKNLLWAARRLKNIIEREN